MCIFTNSDLVLGYLKLKLHPNYYGLQLFFKIWRNCSEKKKKIEMSKIQKLNKIKIFHGFKIFKKLMFSSFSYLKNRWL